MRARHTNNGLRKLCAHPRRRWAKCGCSWHVNYRPRDPARRNPKSTDGGFRFSLDRVLHRHVADKSEAAREAFRIKEAIDAGTFGRPVAREDMTLQQLCDLYQQRYVAVERATTADDFKSGLRVICETPLPQPTGGAAPFGSWRLSDIVTDTIERYREVRRTKGTGVGGANRSLSRLRALLNWGILTGYLERTPFKRGTVTAVKLSRETPRSRRLNADIGEEAKLLGACDPHLRAVVECALETGMRRGEIMSLEWKQVEGITVDKDRNVVWAPKAEIVLLAAKTKTKRDRKIPISGRLKSILEMRRFDPAGEPHAMDRYVFGNAIGQQVDSTKRAWMRAVLTAHGVKPTYTKTMNLDKASRAVLREINLHYHDLRREAGSRWMDAGVPIATIQRWLGHSNVSQTSTYLAGNSTTEHDHMRRFEERQAALQQIATAAGTGGRKGPQTATGRDKKANKNAVGRESAIM